MKIINITYRLTAIIYTCLTIWVLVRWQVFDRPTSKHSGFILELFFIHTALALIIGIILLVQFNQKLNYFPNIKLFFKILVILISLFGSYFIIGGMYIYIDPSVMEYWRTGEWKW